MNETCLRVLQRERDLLRQLVGKPKIIGVQDRNVLPASFGQCQIARGTAPMVLAIGMLKVVNSIRTGCGGLSRDSGSLGG